MTRLVKAENPNSWLWLQNTSTFSPSPKHIFVHTGQWG